MRSVLTPEDFEAASDQESPHRGLGPSHSANLRPSQYQSGYRLADSTRSEPRLCQDQGWELGQCSKMSGLNSLNHSIYEARSRERIMHAVSKIQISQSALLFHARARGRRVGQLEPPAGKRQSQVSLLRFLLTYVLVLRTCLHTW